MSDDKKQESEATKNGDTWAVEKKIDDGEVESQQEKLPYPKAIGFIIGNEFCERFNYYGMRTILVIYLTRILLYSQDTATVIYHVFTMLVYLFCVFGAFISDSWLGKFRTIMYLSIVYVCGSVIISLGAIEPLNLAPVAMTLIGLFLIALGSGGIKPCVAAFGGDQFKLPEQVKQMATFFSIFYFAINSGSLLSTTITPILRQDVYCFDNEHCYPLAFGVPAVLMIVSIVVFILGKPLYVNKPPEGNTFALVVKAIGNGISTKIKERKTNPKEHFLDYAAPKYGQQLVDDVKVLLRVLLLYIPLPVFWALFDQQGSRWTFQATMMEGDLGAFEIKPEQMQLANPLLILILIPCYEYAFYPLLAKIGIRRPLQKLTIGGILAGVSFVLSALVELAIVPTHGVLPSEGMSQLRMFNTLPGCDYAFTTTIPGHERFDLKSMEYFEKLEIDVTDKMEHRFSATATGCGPIPSQKIELEDNAAISYYITGNRTNPQFKKYHDETKKSEQGFAMIRVLTYTTKTVEMYFKPKLNKRIDFNETELVGLQQAEYDLMFGEDVIWSHYARPGDVMTLVVIDNGNAKPEVKAHRLAPENSVNILWQLPQYFVMTLGEVMFSVTGLEFSYAQAPLTMKAVLQACWQLTIAVGNLIVVIIAEIPMFDNQAYEYFLYAGIMFADMVLFMLLARRYIPNDPNKINKITEAEEEETGKKGIINPTFHED